MSASNGSGSSVYRLTTGCVGCDQATKMIARQELATAPMQEYRDGFFRLLYAENPGAFLSLGASLHLQTYAFGSLPSLLRYC
ncbi:MAG: signal peptidase II [Caldilineaceae bacterium]